jgi:dCTP diphosphatase
MLPEVGDAKMDIGKYQERLAVFADARNWEQFHSPKNLSMALAAEAGELLELFQWLKEEESIKTSLDNDTLNRVKEELADILIYLLRIADKLDVDLEEAVNKKIVANEVKYPVDVSYDNATKYNRRQP